MADAYSSDEDEVEYELEDFIIGSTTFSITTIAFMPITKLMKLTSTKTEISGQKLWCGSLVVMQYLLANADFVTATNVIELGAGTGVTGMLCKKLGCLNVFLTDHDECSIRHMISDTLRNEITANVVHLDWYNYNHEDVVKLLESSSSSVTDKNVPLRIVAGDVLYKRVLIQPFFNVISSLLEYPEAKMLLCHVPRADVDHRDVLDACDEYELQVIEISSEIWKKDVVLEYSTPDDYERAKLYLIEKK